MNEKKNLQEKLLAKHMTRREFLQFVGGSFLVLFGLGNLVALMKHVQKTTDEKTDIAPAERHGFGSRKFGA